MKKYKISIITICYNNLLDLVKTHTSLRNYISNEIEWVVIDGSANIEINHYLNNIEKNNIFYLFEKDTGIYDAMNKGIKFANGDYLIFLNSGDTFTNVNLFDISNKLIYDVEVFNINCVDRDNNQLKFRNFSVKIDDLKIRPSVPHQSTFIKKILFENTYDTAYRYLADYDLFCKLYINGAIFNFHSNVFLSNFECEGVTSSFQTALKVANEMKFIQIKHFKKYNYYIYLQNILKYILYTFFRINNLNNLRKL